MVFTDLSENGSLPSHVQYKIKMNKTLVFNPGQLRDRSGHVMSHFVSLVIDAIGLLQRLETRTTRQRLQPFVRG